MSKVIVDSEKEKMEYFCMHAKILNEYAGYYHTKGKKCPDCNTECGKIVIHTLIKPNLFQIMFGKLIGINWSEGRFE